MAEIFPKWTNRLPLMIVIGVCSWAARPQPACGIISPPNTPAWVISRSSQWPFRTPCTSDQLGIDCRYCHSHVEKSWYSNIPASSHVHELPQPGAEGRSAPGFGSRERGRPASRFLGCKFIKMPDYVYFNHSVHVNRGVSCVHCHGQVNKMDEVHHDQAAQHDLLPGLPPRSGRRICGRRTKSLI